MIRTETRHRRVCDLCQRDIEQWSDDREPGPHVGTFLPIEHGVHKLNLRITVGPAVPGGQPPQPGETDVDICRTCARDILQGLANRLDRGQPVVGVMKP